MIQFISYIITYNLNYKCKTMQTNSIDILNFSSCHFFSSQEYRIDSGNLKITDLSLGKNNREVIPLDLIDPKPKIAKTNDPQLILASIISFIIGTLFIILAYSINIPVQQVLGFGLIGISAIFLISSLRLQTTSYTYFYANTTTQLFTISEAQSCNSENAKKFIEALNNRLVKPKVMKSERKKNRETHNEFVYHLDFLYNHNVLNDIQYDRMKDKINEIVYGIKKDRTLADVIHLPVTKF